MEFTKQSSSKKVDNNKDVKISVVKSRKITTTIVNIIFAGKKSLMLSTKRILLESG